MKDLTKWTRKEFEELPLRQFGEDIGPFTSLIILPQRRLHDSGYRIMSFVAVKHGVPICRLGMCSDVLHMDGIGGYHKKIPIEIPAGWTVDCLPTSGLLRLFCSHNITADIALSSQEIFATE